MKLSILIAAYNEQNTIRACVERVLAVPLPHGFEKEIIIVDDCSTDGTHEILQTLHGTCRVFRHEKNRGKGAAIRTGISKATGDYIIMQDADTENDPNDIARMLSKMLEDNLVVLYGSRWLGKKEKSYAQFAFFAGGVLLTKLTNVLYRQRLTDMLTCYKMYRADLLKSLPLKSERFEYEAEVTAYTALRGIRITEIPISYYPRTVHEGKKIRWKDGVALGKTLVKVRFSFNRLWKNHKVALALFCLALSVRTALFLVNLHANGGNFEATIHGQDGFFEVGRNIATGTGFTWDGMIPTAVHMPLYPLFLAASLYFFGSYVLAVIVQVLVGSLLPVLGRRIALKLIASEKIALFVGVVLALDPYFALLSFITYSETVFMGLFFLFVLAFMSYLERGDTRSLCISSILLGLATLAKTSTQFFPILLLPLMWWYLRKKLSARRIAMDSALMIVTFLIVLFPWAYRNKVVFGHYDTTVMPTWNLYTCLVPSVLAVANHTSFAAEAKAFIDDRQKADMGRQLTFATAPQYRAEAMPIIYAHPLALVEVSLINVVTFFTHDGMLGVLQYAGIVPKVHFSQPALTYLLSDPVDFIREAAPYLVSPFVLVFIVRVFWIIITLAAFMGTWILVWKKKVSASLAFALVLVAYFALTTMTNGLTVNVRFRMPVDPILLALAGVGVSYGIMQMKLFFRSKQK